MSGIKDFFMQKMLEKQLAGLPAEQREKMMKAISDNPDLFTALATDIAERVKKGEPQMSAVMAVVTDKKAELQRILGAS